MMQEHVQERTVELTIHATKLTARVLAKALRAVLALAVKHHNSGKQSVKRLIRKGQGASSLEIADGNIRSFKRIAHKYGIDYAVRRDVTDSPTKWLVFFKGRDADVLTAAFKEFSTKTLRKRTRPSVRAKLAKFKDVAKVINAPDKVHNKAREKSR